MSLAEFISGMPKVELHVHLEGSIRPETLLRLARRNRVALPADTVEGLRDWYTFRDFPHFVQIYVTASKCIRTPEDIELIAREFVDGQVEQNVLHTEVTYTAETILRHCGIPWDEQLAALQSARSYAQSRGVTVDYILDIVREVPAQTGLQIARWALSAQGDGVCALGLTGVEADTSASRHVEAFREAKAGGLRIATHAGESSGPETIRDCLELLGADRIGHGIRCLEDPALVDVLRERQIPLEVCPSSNVCLGFAPSFAEHPINAMIDHGLNVSVNSDDPPMFNTTLSGEWERCVETFGWSKDRMMSIQVQTIEAAFVSESRKSELNAAVGNYFSK
jgi:adenosine deaminase